MLAQFRTFARSTPAKILLVLVGVGFLFVGGRTVVSGGGLDDAVVRAGHRKITSAQFRALFERYRAQVAQQQAQPGSPPPTPMSVEDAVKQKLDLRALDEIAYEEALAALIERDGVRPADTLIAGELRKASSLFDPLTRKFDKTAYDKFLAQNGLTRVEFESSLRDQIAQQHMFTGLVAGLQAPAAYSALQAAFNHEGRRFQAMTIPTSAAPPPSPPTEAELQAFMRENAKALMKPEMRQVTLVRFSASLLAPTVAVDEAAVQKRFEFEKESLSTPETRSLVQIPLRSSSQASTALAELKAGKDPAAVARSIGAQPIVYSDAVRTAVPDPRIAAVAFAMSSGEVRGPVEGGLGAAVLQVSKITPGRTATLDQARPKLETEVRKYAAMQKANELLQKFEDARSGGASLVDAARTAGVPAVPAPAFDAQGRAADGRQLPLPRKLVDTAFGLPLNGDSQVLEAGQGQGEFYAIHLDHQSPPGPLTLDEIRAPLARRLMLQAAVKSLKAKAEGLAAAVRGGRSMSQVAGAAGLALAEAEVRRDDAQAGQSYGREFLEALFEARPGAVLVGATAAGAVVVAKVEPQGPGDPAQIARLAQGVRQSASSGLYEDVAVHARDAARMIVKPKIDPRRARRALGVDGPTPAAGS